MNPEYDAALIAEGVPNISVPKVAETATAGVGFLGGLTSVLSPVAGGLGLAGGLAGMFGDSPGSSDYSSAGGTLYGGSFSPVIFGGKSSNTLLIIIAIFALILVMRK